jgi:hypothetical protein
MTAMIIQRSNFHSELKIHGASAGPPWPLIPAASDYLHMATLSPVSRLGAVLRIPVKDVSRRPSAVDQVVELGSRSRLV